MKGAVVAAAFLLRGLPALAELADSGGLPEGRLSFYNVHSEERLSVTYRDSAGVYDPGALEAIDTLLRCRFTGEVASMDLRVIEYLNLIDKDLGGDREIHIISGFRSSDFNSLLSSKGRGVAKNSLHTKGRALDIRIPGVEMDALRDKAYALRYGGVGFYPKDRFVHIDSGRFRTWTS